jgi:hypothetical protein
MSTVYALLLKKGSAKIYADPAKGDFRLRDLERILGQGSSLGNIMKPDGTDLCDQPYRDGNVDIGPIQYSLAMACTPVLP